MIRLGLRLGPSQLTLRSRGHGRRVLPSRRMASGLRASAVVRVTVGPRYP